MARRLKVYVAGPYSNNDPAKIEENVQYAIHISNCLLNLGYVPFCPHLTHYWHLTHPQEYQTWLDYDNEFLRCCDVLLRLPGLSSGADSEVALALELEMPVFLCVDKLICTCPPELQAGHEKTNP